MDDTGLRGFLTEIVTMPSAEQARDLALSNRKLLLSPAAFRIVQDMVRDAASEADRAAWTSLLAFRAELFERTVTGRSVDIPPLPRLAVAPDPTRDRFRYWLDRIQAMAPERATGATGAFRVLALDRRHTALLPRTMFGMADDTVVSGLEEILAGYHAVLADGEHSPLSIEDILRRCAQVCHTLGRAAASLDRPAHAEEHYRAAGDLYERIGDAEQAAEARTSAARTRESADRDVDAELRRLHTALDALPAPSTRRAALVVELAELHVRNGNDIDAQRWLAQAQDMLASLGHDDPAGPTGTRLAQALTSFATAGDADTLDELMRVRNLYDRIYAAWQQIRQTEGDVEEARRYTELAAGLDDEAANEEFSRRMRAALPEIFGDT